MSTDYQVWDVSSQARNKRREIRDAAIELLENGYYDTNLTRSKKLSGKPTKKQSKLYRKPTAGTKESTYQRYMESAEKRKLDFSIFEYEFYPLLTLPCTYCGRPNSNGVDRIDSSKGYTPENSTPCCTICNMMKHRYSVADFIAQCHRIIAHQNTLRKH